MPGLGITEAERSMIVTAMSYGKGHWNKCKNGHVYCIAGCGGANEVGKCPECKETIGKHSFFHSIIFHMLRCLRVMMIRADSTSYKQDRGFGLIGNYCLYYASMQFAQAWLESKRQLLPQATHRSHGALTGFSPQGHMLERWQAVRFIAIAWLSSGPTNLFHNKLSIDSKVSFGHITFTEF